MDLPTIVLHPRHGPGLGAALAELDGVMVETPSETAMVVEAIRSGASGLVTYQWDDEFLTGGLRWVQAISAGIDQFPIDQLAERGIVLTSARGAHSPAVADHAIALLLTLLRRIGPAVRRAAEHDWRPEMAHETEGLTVGVVGLGAIGEQVARRLRALEMGVIGAKSRPTGYEGVVEDVRGPDHIISVFADSDAVVLALPSTPATEGIIGPPHLEALDGGWLVNVGRGSVVDENALVTALMSGRLRGAALDVTATEPLPPNSPLWDMPQVVITPHMGWASDRLSPRLARLVAANVAALRKEGPWVNRVL